MYKLQLVYKFSNSQGIKFGLAGQVVTPLPATTTHIPNVEVTEVAPEVDHIASVVAIFFVEDTPQSPVLTKRDQDEHQHSPLEEGSSKWTHLFGDIASGEMTPFLRLPAIPTSWIPFTPKETITTISTKDLFFVQSLSEVEKMKLLSEVTFHM